MDNEQLLRYGRQILLSQIGIEGQQRLLDARVLIIGLGGLGSPVAMYLASAGVGHLTLVDFDTVDLSNLQRQIAHGTEDIGRRKVDSARDTLLRLNDECQVDCVGHRLDEPALAEQARTADLVLDCSDNFGTRFAVNAACAWSGTPLVTGAALRMEGQVSLFTGQPGEPCYRCLYGEEGQDDQRCSENGVLAPVVGIIGSIQATEALKWLSGAGTPLAGRLLVLDALEMTWRTLKLTADPDCPVCATKPAAPGEV
jgi:molybdopterin/thiamine biosynthesis adenylyltransferase